MTKPLETTRAYEKAARAEYEATLAAFRAKAKVVEALDYTGKYVCFKPVLEGLHADNSLCTWHRVSHEALSPETWAFAVEERPLGPFDLHDAVREHVEVEGYEGAWDHIDEVLIEQAEALVTEAIKTVPPALYVDLTTVVVFR